MQLDTKETLAIISFVPDCNRLDLHFNYVATLNAWHLLCQFTHRDTKTIVKPPNKQKVAPRAAKATTGQPCAI